MANTAGEETTSRAVPSGAIKVTPLGPEIRSSTPTDGSAGVVVDVVDVVVVVELEVAATVDDVAAAVEDGTAVVAASPSPPHAAATTKTATSAANLGIPISTVRLLW